MGIIKAEHIRTYFSTKLIFRNIIVVITFEENLATHSNSVSMEKC